jgi:superfamily II DNA or RNA helicase
VPGLRTVPLPSVPHELLEQYVNPAGIEVAVEKAREHLRRIGRTRAAPRRTPQPHQNEVVQSWLKEQRGIIDHVTGGGKTLSALEILRRWLSYDRSRCAIVLVPSDLLSQQWLHEIQRELEDLQPRRLVVGGSLSAPNWLASVTAFTAPSKIGPRIIVSTMQSASSDRFIQRVTGGDHLLIVADEVHRLGSRRHREVMQIAAGGRLGLSATPERQGDPEGTHALFDYFGPTLEPHFGIPEAQRAGRLVPYDYFINTVVLEEDEDAEYSGLTQRINELRARAGDHLSEDDQRRLDMLRIHRARIVKKARQKVPHAIRLLNQEYVPGQRWLIYCEDTEQLGMVRDGLLSSDCEVLEYHSQMVGDPPATLRSFERYGGVLVSIRCLDEGIDIPMVDHALILASSTNSREYIQRRGRVLRTSPGKYSAEIYDVLVCLDADSHLEVLNRDYIRARQFAAFARNEACRYRLDALRAAAEDADVEYEEEVEDSPW